MGLADWGNGEEAMFQTAEGFARSFTKRTLALFVVPVLALGTVVAVTVVPSAANHSGPGPCYVTQMAATQDSTTVRSPLGQPGLRIAFEGHCDPGSASTTEFRRNVTVAGTIVASLTSIDSSTAGSARDSLKELHLPVQAAGQVCLEDPDNPANTVCVPPS